MTEAVLEVEQEAPPPPDIDAVAARKLRHAAAFASS